MALRVSLLWGTTGLIAMPTTTLALPAVVVADVDDYFAAGLKAAAWDLLSPSEKAASVNDSILWLGTLHWDLEADCQDRVLDDAYLAAVSELALALFRDSGALIGPLSNDGRMIMEERVEGLALHYAPQPFFQPGARGNLLQQRFPWLRQLIGCWADFGINKEIRLYRN
jgi:hypothetical protein